MLPDMQIGIFCLSMLPDKQQGTGQANRHFLPINVTGRATRYRTSKLVDSAYQCYRTSNKVPDKQIGIFCLSMLLDEQQGTGQANR
jgi:hypothetical protein